MRVVGIDFFLYAGRIYLIFSDHRNWLSFRVGGRSWLDFSVGYRTWRGFSVGIKLIWLLRSWSKFTWFQYRDHSWLGFCVTVKNDLSLVSGSKLTPFSCRGLEADMVLVEIEIDSFSVMGSKLTCFSCTWSKLSWFWWGDRNWLDFGAGVKIVFVLMYRPKFTWF